MATGMWTAVSGASAQAQNVDMVANNLANMDTVAFKKDMPTFKEYLSHVERSPEGQEIPRGPIKERDLHPLEGKDQSFVVIDGTYTNLKQGPLKVTQSPFDLALEGAGFLEVSTPSGIRYTRQGSLKVAPDGRLVTSEGFPVLSAANAAPNETAVGAPLLGQNGLTGQGPQRGLASEQVAGRFINLRDRAGAFSVSSNGDVYVGGELIAKLALTEFNDPRALRKTGSGLFENPNPAGNAVRAAENIKTVIHQGMIEMSNVNPVEEMTNLIKANRMFEHDLKVMKTYGEMLGREANDVGKL